MNELAQVIGVTTDMITVTVVTIQGNTEVVDVVLRAPDTVDVVTVINTNKDSFPVLRKSFSLQRRLISIVSVSLFIAPFIPLSLVFVMPLFDLKTHKKTSKAKTTEPIFFQRGSSRLSKAGRTVSEATRERSMESSALCVKSWDM